MVDEFDVYGRMMFDHFQGKEVTEIVERSDGLIDVTSGPGVYFSVYEEWMPEEQEAVAYARGRTLDIGCGAGRHALYLQEQGLPVLGLDSSPLALEVCRQRGLQETCLLPAAQISSRLGQFDTMMMMGNNFGLFANRHRGRWLLRRFRAMMAANGRLIVSSNDPYRTEDPIHLAYHEQNRQRGRMAGQVRIRVRYRNLKGPWFDYLFVSQQEMLDLIRGTGWQVSRFIVSPGATYKAILEKALIAETSQVGSNELSFKTYDV